MAAQVLSPLDWRQAHFWVGTEGSVPGLILREGIPMLALCRSGLFAVLPVATCGLIAWVVTNRLRKAAVPVKSPSDYERLRRIYGTRPSVN